MNLFKLISYYLNSIHQNFSFKIKLTFSLAYLIAKHNMLISFYNHKNHIVTIKQIDIKTNKYDLKS